MGTQSFKTTHVDSDYSAVMHKGSSINSSSRGIYNSLGKPTFGSLDDDSDVGDKRMSAFVSAANGAHHHIPAGAYPVNGNNTSTLIGTDEYTNNSTTTGQVAVGSSVTGTINSITDTDWIAVTLTSGTQYTIDLTKLSTSQSALSNPYIAGIYNTNGTLISGTTDDNSGGNNNSHLTFTPATSGTYYICADGTGRSTGDYLLSVEESADSTQWTVMTYMSADNNLEAAALADVNEMEAAEESVTITMTCILDRSRYYSSADGNWSNTREGVIESDGVTSHVSSLASSLTEQNMGSVTTLTEFINWSDLQTDSDSNALILWNHGGGISGSCWDYGNGYSNLSMEDIATAIESSTVGTMDLVAFDACYMAVLDQAYILSDCAEIMVASEDTMPSTGFDYTSLINDFSNTTSSDQTASTLASQIIQAYDDSNTETVTLSALDLTKMDELILSMSNFKTVWDSEGISSSILISSENETLRYDDYIDLSDFMENIQTYSSSNALDSAAQTVIDALNDLVIASCGSADSSGLTIYMPETADTSYLTGTGNDLIAATGWSEIYSAIWSQT